MSLSFRLFISILPLGLAGAGILYLLFIINQPDRFPLRSIEIQNELKWMQPSAISQVIAPFMEQGFFGIDVETIQKQVNQLPWVLNSHVQRIWPDKISVSLNEQNPLARFAEQGLLSTEGKIFYPENPENSENQNNLPAGLPWFQGPENAAMDMLKHYLDFLEMLSPLGLSIAELHLSNEGAYRLRLDNGLDILLGKTALNERLGRFILVYPSQLKKETSRIAYLDLRYTNGMAVGWKIQSDQHLQDIKTNPAIKQSHAGNANHASNASQTNRMNHENNEIDGIKLNEMNESNGIKVNNAVKVQNVKENQVLKESQVIKESELGKEASNSQFIKMSGGNQR